MKETPPKRQLWFWVQGLGRSVNGDGVAGKRAGVPGDSPFGFVPGVAVEILKTVFSPWINEHIHKATALET